MSDERDAPMLGDGDDIPGDGTLRLSLREIVLRHLGGDRRVEDEVRELAHTLAASARESGHGPERLVIGIRTQWRELGLSQSDRLQAARLYDALVRHSIEKYYDGA